MMRDARYAQYRATINTNIAVITITAFEQYTTPVIPDNEITVTKEYCVITDHAVRGN